MFIININYNYKRFMKNLSLLFAFSLAFIFCVNAQENRSYYVQQNQNQSSEKEESDSKYLFIGGGFQGNVYMNDNARHDGDDHDVWKNPSLAGNLFVGKWFGPKIGARVVIEGGSMHPFFQNESIMEHEKYISGRIDLLFNITNLFREYSPDRFYNLAPYIGIGGAYAFDVMDRNVNSKNYRSDINVGSFMFGGGLFNTFRLSDKISAYLDLGVNVVDAKFDGWKDDKSFNGIFSPAIGVVYKFGSK